jgi:hypothetical protein
MGFPSILIRSSTDCTMLSYTTKHSNDLTALTTRDQQARNHHTFIGTFRQNRHALNIVAGLLCHSGMRF